MVSVINKVSKLQEESYARFYELEEKRMKMEERIMKMEEERYKVERKRGTATKGRKGFSIKDYSDAFWSITTPCTAPFQPVLWEWKKHVRIP